MPKMDVDMENVRMSIELCEIFGRILGVVSLMANPHYARDDAFKELTKIAVKLQEDIGELNLIVVGDGT